MGRVVILLLKLTHEAETQACMYILYLFKAVFIAHDISLEKKGLECTLYLPGKYWRAVIGCRNTTKRIRKAGRLGKIYNISQGNKVSNHILSSTYSTVYPDP